MGYDGTALGVLRGEPAPWLKVRAALVQTVDIVVAYAAIGLTVILGWISILVFFSFMYQLEVPDSILVIPATVVMAAFGPALLGTVAVAAGFLPWPLELIDTNCNGLSSIKGAWLRTEGHRSALAGLIIMNILLYSGVQERNGLLLALLLIEPLAACARAAYYELISDSRGTGQLTPPDISY